MNTVLALVTRFLTHYVIYMSGDLSTSCTYAIGLCVHMDGKANLHIGMEWKLTHSKCSRAHTLTV